MTAITYYQGRNKIETTTADLSALYAAANATEPFARLADTECDSGKTTDNPYWELVRLLPRDTAPYGDPWAVESYQGYGEGKPSLLHREPQTVFAWSIPSPADLAWMLDLLEGRDVVEIGAGAGYWAWQLRQLGVQIAAVDNGTWTFPNSCSPVEHGGADTAALHPDRALLLVWPPYGTAMATDALAAYAGDLVIYAGEGDGGCTGDQIFHDQLAAEWTEISRAPHHATFWGVHCRLTAYRRAVAE
ncbi:hypothetical protein ACTWPB_07455 [Nocardia sp. IBHARD005]|uniref:hypothetical protein n=1 Tax=Nocardia sp. IBHARD005 TaxID=3457765 RepID=UPI0040583561